MQLKYCVSRPNKPCKMIKFTLLFLISSTFYQYTVQDTVNITVYYEALSFNCEDFLLQLGDGYETLGESLVIDLVPYGNTKRSLIDGKWEFKCVHGPDECFSNKMQGCIIKHYPDTTTQLNFIGCILDDLHPTSIDIEQRCAEKNNIEWNEIMQCIEGSEGDQIMLHNAILTEALNELIGVPWLVVNGKQDLDTQYAIRANVVEAVCGMLKLKPKSCFEK